jgi:hypothetical protein
MYIIDIFGFNQNTVVVDAPFPIGASQIMMHQQRILIRLEIGKHPKVETINKQMKNEFLTSSCMKYCLGSIQITYAKQLHLITSLTEQFHITYNPGQNISH